MWTPRGPQGLCPEGETPLEQRLPSGTLSDTSNNPLPSCPKAAVSYASPTPSEVWGLCPPLGCHSPLLLRPSCVRRVSGFLTPRTGPPPTVVMHPSALRYALGHSLGGLCVAVPRGAAGTPGPLPPPLALSHAISDHLPPAAGTLVGGCQVKTERWTQWEHS